MRNKSPGQTSLKVIGRELSLKPHAVKDLQKILRDENHKTTLALRSIGVTYDVVGAGRGAKSYLVKAAV
jgi:hypothetical protein